MRLRRVITTEVEWDAEQRGWMLALAEYRATHCDGCGEPLAESTHKDNEYAYTAVGPFGCHACRAIDRALEQSEQGTRKAQRGDRWKVERKAVA